MTTTPTTLRARLLEHSRMVLLENQTPGGAFVASPTYPTYRFSWLRDGSFVADALDRVGEPDAAARFHGWVRDTVLGLEDVFRAARENASTADPQSLPPTRFDLDGTVESGEEDWPNFQLDGYGTWLWALGQHLSRSSRTAGTAELRAVRLVADYLVAAGDRACYDCWEESVDRRHAATIAASVAGLRSAAELTGEQRYEVVADELRATLLRDFVHEGSFVKHDGTDAVDASLLWIAQPFAVVPVDDPLTVRTVERVTRELRVPGGGVRRYLGDTFYGGGEWILLTAWLAWVHDGLGDADLAAELLAWVEDQSTAGLDLPEQVATHAQAPDRIAEWVDRWGPAATPLLWSHAMYLTALAERGEA